MRCRLHDHDLRGTEVIYGHEPDAGLLEGGHPRTISHEWRAPGIPPAWSRRAKAFRSCR